MGRYLNTQRQPLQSWGQCANSALIEPEVWIEPRFLVLRGNGSTGCTTVLLWEELMQPEETQAVTERTCTFHSQFLRSGSPELWNSSTTKCATMLSISWSCLPYLKHLKMFNFAIIFSNWTSRDIFTSYLFKSYVESCLFFTGWNWWLQPSFPLGEIYIPRNGDHMFSQVAIFFVVECVCCGVFWHVCWNCWVCILPRTLKKQCN